MVSNQILILILLWHYLGLQQHWGYLRISSSMHILNKYVGLIPCISI